MVYTLLFIGAIILIIFILDSVAVKRPRTNEEILDAIKYSVNRITEKYDFDKNLNIGRIENLKTSGWYVSDCGHYYHIIKFSKDGEVKLSTATKEVLKSWDFTEYMNDIVQRLNKKIKLVKRIDPVKNQIIITFPEHPSQQIIWACKMKSNGVLIIRKIVIDKGTALLDKKEHQYLWMTERSLGYDIKLHEFLSDH